MPTFKIVTLGCKVNQFESEAIGQSLEESGHRRAKKQAPSDVCIINTCTVTQKASMQSRQAIRHAIRKNPDARIIVTGCYAQTRPEDIRDISGVHDIIGHTAKHNIPDFIINPEGDPLPALPRTHSSDIFQETVFKQIPGRVTQNRTRPFLKIQDGCDAFCTYCIVPLSRGPSRSMPAKDVLARVKQLADDGYKEIVLTGIHLGCYGHDLSLDNGHLFDLMAEIEHSGAIDRIRLSSIEPLELTGDIISLAASSRHICRHFHIPLQSGDDDILKKMNRPYSADVCRELILNIHSQIPDAAIGADILIGFPGETEQAFMNTSALIEALPVTYLHVFPFSPRKGTPAAGYPNQIPPEIIKERCRHMRELGFSKKHTFIKQHIGKTADILIETTRDRESGLLKGLTSNYITVLLNGPDSMKNRLVHGNMTRLYTAHTIMGTYL